MLLSASALTHPDALREFVAATEPRAPFTRVLMADPEYFQVRYEINPHMAGRSGSVNPAAARAEWGVLKENYETLGFPVLVCPPHPDFPDLAFAANQSLPHWRGTHPRALLSRMASAQRVGEVAVMENFLTANGIACETLETSPFEGCGDALWHPGRALLWGGHGFRTGLEAWEEVARKTGARVVPLRLVDERCYHLDVCLMLVSDDIAFACRDAFDGESWARLRAGFSGLIEADRDETFSGFALNGHCPDGKNLLLPAGNPRIRAQAEALGLRVHELPTREFQKAGGSIFCLKNMLP